MARFNIRIKGTNKPSVGNIEFNLIIEALYCRKNTKPSVSSHETLFFREISSANTEGFFVLKPQKLLQNLYANLH